MHNQLTEVDIQKMKEEIEYRITVKRPLLLKEVVRTVTVYVEEDDAEETYRLVTTARADVLENRISGESPMGKALLGHKVGDRILIEVNPTYSYYVVIRSIEKGTDDASLSIN